MRTALARRLRNFLSLLIIATALSVNDVGHRCSERDLSWSLEPRRVLSLPPSCQHLDLSNTRLGDKELPSLVESLVPVRGLNELLLQRNRISDLQPLADFLPKANITVLHLSSNSIGDAGALALAKALADSRTTLLELHVANNDIGTFGATAMARALKHSSLETLSLSYNAVGLSHISPGYAHRRTVRKDEFAISLSRSLKATCQLRFLYAVSVEIGDAAAFALGEALSEDPLLEVLALDMNRISDAGAIGLAQGLKSSSHLTELRLGGRLKGSARLSEDGDSDGTRIGDPGARAIGEALAKGTSPSVLQILDLSRGSVGDDGAAALAEFLRVDSSLRILRLQENEIGDDGAHLLGQALREHGVLEELHLRHNAIHTEGGVALLAALRSNPQIHQLVLYDNSIDGITMDRLRDILHSDDSVREEAAEREKAAFDTRVHEVGSAAGHDGLKGSLQPVMNKCGLGHVFDLLCEEMGIQETGDLEDLHPSDIHSSTIGARERAAIIACVCQSELAGEAHALCEDHRDL